MYKSEIILYELKDFKVPTKYKGDLCGNTKLI